MRSVGAGKVTTLGECLAWLQKCSELIKQLEEHSRAKRARLSIGYRQPEVLKSRDSRV